MTMTPKVGPLGLSAVKGKHSMSGSFLAPGQAGRLTAYRSRRNERTGSRNPLGGETGMASIAQHGPASITAERRFFFVMSLVLIATAVVGFGYFKVSGKSSFLSPWWVHLHAVTMVGWLAFYAFQNSLVVRGDFVLHRRLGKFGAIYAGWVIIYGIAMSYLVISSGRNPPFTPPEMMALNLMNVGGFAILFIAAFRLRARTDWHKRLMLCAMICGAAPAYGRVLIMLDARSNLTYALYVLSYIAIAAVGDAVINRRLHPAFIWGFGTAAVTTSLIGVLPGVEPFAALALSFAG
jgi:hypothetical protein